MRLRQSRYVALRLVRFALTVWLGATVIFIIPRLSATSPMDAVLGRLAASGASVADAPRLIESYKRRFGLGQSVWVQYTHYLENVFTFHNGYSISAFPATVDQLVSRALPWSVGLLLLSTLLSFAIGTFVGATLGWPRTPGWVRRSLPLSLIFTSLPAFMLGILLIYAFSFRLGWFPYAGAYSVGSSPTWSLSFAGDVVRHGFLPAVSIILVTMGTWALGMRGMMITTAGEDYMTLAEAKGLPPRRVFWSYAVRNAFLPQVTALALSLGTIASGFVVVETVFNYPGLGSLLYSGIVNNDYPVIQGVAFYLVLGVALAVLVLDLIYPLLDPRTRATAS